MEPCKSFTGQLVQFDWRLVSVLGSSASSATSPTSDADSLLLQLKLDLANRAVMSSESCHNACPLSYYPNGIRTDQTPTGVAADSTIVMELSSTVLDQMIIALNDAITRCEA